MISVRFSIALALALIFVQASVSSALSFKPTPTPHRPHKPVHRPHKPIDRPHKPVDRPHKPVHRPHKPVDRPHKPVHRPHKPVDRPHKPIHRPHKPIHRPHKPVHRPHKPVHPPVEKISCHKAFRKCDFRFKGFTGIPTFNIHGFDNKAFTSQVISKNRHEILGVLNSNHIVPEFIINHKAQPITKFGTQKFTPTAFKPFPIPHTYGSGVGRETLHGDQLHIAKGQCVRIFFTSYQILSKYNYNVIDNKNHVPRSANKCVVFRTAA